MSNQVSQPSTAPVLECPFCGVDGEPFGKGSYSFMHKPDCYLNDGSNPRIVYTEQVESWNTRIPGTSPKAAKVVS